MPRRLKRRLYARVRRKPKKKGEPNGLELRHKAEVIGTDANLILIGYECLTVRLADNTSYTADFVVQHKDDGEIELHEVKGGVWLGDSRVKFKMAAELYPQFHWKSYLYSGKVLKKVEDL